MTPSIVCGIDASTQAQNALGVATALAERLSRRLILVHAVQTPTPDLLLTAPARVPAAVKNIDLLGHDTGERLLNKAVEEHHLPNAERRLERGGGAERLGAIAREEHAEFIVVGSRGAGSLSSALLGSVSTAVVRDAPCPVVVVPPAMTGTALDGERILCGFQADTDRPAITVGSRLARDLDVPVTVAHILPSGPEVAALAPASVLRATAEYRPEADQSHALQTIHRLVEAAGEDTNSGQQQIRLRNGDPAGQLLELAALTRAMLLVVGSRRLGRCAGDCSARCRENSSATPPTPSSSAGKRNGRDRRRIVGPSPRPHGLIRFAPPRPRNRRPEPSGSPPSGAGRPHRCLAETRSNSDTLAGVPDRPGLGVGRTARSQVRRLEAS